MLSDQPNLKRMLRTVALSATTAMAIVFVGPLATAQASSPALVTNPVSATNIVASSTPAGGVTLQTEEPAITKADENLLVQVRLAGLWEIPASKMAMEKASTPRVREIAQMIASQHVRLDTLDKAAAAEVGVELPDRPTAQQRRWLDEMTDASGAAFDDIYVQRLRVAHGKVFPVIGIVRATTDSDPVRKLAQSANAFVLAHLTYLESTGLVRYEELPQANSPGVWPSTSAANRSTEGGIATPAIWLILATALIAGAVFTTRMVRPRSFGGRSKGRRRAGSDDYTGPIPVQAAADNFYPKQGLRLSNSPRSLP